MILNPCEMCCGKSQCTNQSKYSKGKIFIFTGPIGAGRHTVAEMCGLTLGINQVIWCTTRHARRMEIDHQDYHFITPAAFFQAHQNNEFLEVSDMSGNLYGIKVQDIKQMLQTEGSIYLTLNRKGAEKLKELYGKHVIRVFIHAEKNLVEDRLREKGITEEEIRHHLSNFEVEEDYRSHCEHVFEIIDLAHTTFDLANTLDQYLKRNLIDLD